MSATQSPAPNPCASCPYRRDVPSGVWSASEYAKLPPYDNDTQQQPIGLFLCHQTEREDSRARVCAGWAHLADYHTLALRFAGSYGSLTDEQIEGIVDYQTSVPLFESGAEAAAHGMAEVANPGEAAQAAMAKISRKRGLL